MAEPAYAVQAAAFDPDRRYRYSLIRAWDLSLPRVAFIMLNPSTADETALDPTLRRCLNFARWWDFGSFEIGNLFALRSTDPSALRDDPDPEGPENDDALRTIAGRAALIVCGWGTNGPYRNRADRVCRLLAGHTLHALRLTKAGDPSHPLYLSGSLRPFVWRASQGDRRGP